MSSSTPTVISSVRRTIRAPAEDPAAEQFTPYDERVVLESYHLDVNAHNEVSIKRTVITVKRVVVRPPQDGDDIIELFQEGERLHDAASSSSKRTRDAENLPSKRLTVEDLVPRRRSSRIAANK